MGCAALRGSVEPEAREALGATRLPDTHRLARFLLAVDLLRMMGGAFVPEASIEVGIERCSLFEKYCCHSFRVAFLRIFQRFNCISYCQELVEKRLADETMVANKDKRADMSQLT